MKANELRIGNWINTDGLGEEQVVDVLCDSVNTKTYEGITYDMIEPIPLTDEWLKKFGFFHDGQTSSRLKIDCDLGVLMIPLKPPLLPMCRYVHQLQNIYFALTGKELEIKQLVK